MKKLDLVDFRGGRNTLLSPDNIRANEASAQQDTWCETGALSKRRGNSAQTVTISKYGVSLNPLTCNQLKATLLNSGSPRLSMMGLFSALSLSPRLLFNTDNGSTFAFDGYTDGTVSTDGAGNLTGVGTAFVNNVAVGDYVFINGDASLRKVTTVTDNTHLVLNGSTALSGVAYMVCPALSTTYACGMALFDVSGVQNLFIADGTRAYRVTATTMYRMDTAVTMPAGFILLAHKNYLHSFGQGDKTQWQWCTIKDATTWPAANKQTVTTVNDPIISAYIYADSIIVFTQFRLFRIVGDIFDPSAPQYFIQKIDVPAGYQFMHDRAMTVHQGTLKWLAWDGWYEYNGGPAAVRFSNIIDPDVIYNPDAVSAGTEPQGFADDTGFVHYVTHLKKAIVHKERMWCPAVENSIGGSAGQTLNNTIYVLDENRKWWRWATSVNDMELMTFGSGFKLYGVANSASLLTLDTGSSDGASAISGSWTSKEFPFSSDVEFLYMDVTYKKQSAGNLTVSFSIDRRTFVDKTCDMTAGAGTFIRRRVPINRIGKAIRFKFANAVAAQTFEIYGATLYFNETEATRA
jgi:hypothetical protein